MTNGTADPGRPLTPSDMSSLRSLPGNDVCADCSAPIPQWASINHGTLVCLECSGAHRGLGVHISFVRSLTLDNWNQDQFAYMKAGGNGRCNDYLAGRNLQVRTYAGDRGSIQAKYSGIEANDYRSELEARVREGSTKSKQAAPSRPSSSSPAGATSSSMQHQPVTLSIEPERPAPSDYYPITYYCLLGRRGVTAVRLVSVLLASGALSLVLIPRIFPRRNAFTLRLISVAIIGVSAAAIAGLIFSFSRDLVKHRQPAYNSARNRLVELIRKGRAYRNKTYDLFLPELPDNRKVDIGFILIPGALVDHTAYAIIASRLADAGILVVVMNLDPFRIPLSATGADKTDVLKIMYDVVAGGANGEDVGVASVKEWALGGHSQGGFQAFELCVQMKPGISKLVMWSLWRASELSGSLQGKIDALVMYGTEDVFCTQCSNSEITKFRSRITSSEGKVSFVRIEGGNHAGFAHYGPQTFPARDGERTITLDEQQRICVDCTASFLKGVAVSQPTPNK